MDLRCITANPALQRLQDDLMAATGLPGGCGVFAANGQRVLPLDLTRFPRVCRMVWTSDIGPAACKAEFKLILKKIAITREAWHDSGESGGNLLYHTCHAGLVIAAAPIVHSEELLGVVLCGQVFLVPVPQRSTGAQFDFFAPPAPRRGISPRATGSEASRKGGSLNAALLGLEQGELEKALDEVPVLTEAQLEGAARLFQSAVTNAVIADFARLSIERQAELEKLLYETELGLLQSQINPHFLFNTLNNIMWLANIERANETSRIAHALASLLRYSLRQIGRLVPLREEIDHIKVYLSIQEARFGDRMEFRIEADPAVVDVTIPVLTLQPFVENAIIHGLEPKGTPGTLWIRARKDGNDAIVEIADDGVGMDEDKIALIMQKANGLFGESRASGLGIVSVARRLRHQLGEACKLTLEGGKGKGTTVRIRIPCSG